ncbi:hypothetical protein MIZ03_1691 [Rhodoferax lithotrophicus]|uniref:AttH domain-containing protein n=1 Tax=Rhodoferax lithotrophicus TaxID=2798804 RepID=A0ABN6D4A4_9BURK|nr:carotenoid 1,2-hydratase [Rhodoferax sp. MIZ03]BCO26805.1 hypothetical protein MIZ03_1691 [Rhodoferax sp. MIZ03]
MNRRQCLSLGLAWSWWLDTLGASNRAALTFPRDLGSHPDHAIEWWYLTGQLLAGSRQFGFQLTFFRSRVPQTQGMRSAFAAKQLIFAHAAVTDVAGLRLLHSQRLARASGTPGLDLAEASTADTHVNIGSWHLQHEASTYLAQASGTDFSFQLRLHETQALLLQGDQGWSRKGPQEEQASLYYSLPQLSASGQLHLAGQTFQVQGRAWLDHEWSQSLMPPQAVGWDWVGMNLIDGSALIAFRLRSASGETLWAGGSFRTIDQSHPLVLGPQDVVFTPGRVWKSPASGSTYPVEWSVVVRLHGRSPSSVAYVVKAVIDNQELDSQASTGAIYWEGLSELRDAQHQVIGHGYLEMTGYSSPLRL